MPTPGDMMGAALEATGVPPGYPHTRAEEVLSQVGLHHAADRKVGDYSLGMREMQPLVHHVVIMRRAQQARR